MTFQVHFVSKMSSADIEDKVHLINSQMADLMYMGPVVNGCQTAIFSGVEAHVVWITTQDWCEKAGGLDPA